MRNAYGTTCIALLIAAAPAAAQQPDPVPTQVAAAADSAATPRGAETATIIRAGEPRLVFDREVFRYPGRARRDPFRPLTGPDSGPLFSDLRLSMIIFSETPAESVAGITDLAGNRYRVRRGETVGNATVVDIGQTRVVFSVNDFGLRRQEILDLTANREGATSR
jgi:hypothetical protein